MTDTNQERVKRLIEIRTSLEDRRWEFAKKHGFAHTRSQNFKNCIVIRWKTSKVKYEINQPRIEEYVQISHDLCDKYDLWDKEDWLQEIGLMVLKAGIYCFYEWDYQTWAIPNEYKEIQEYVLGKLPKWAKVSVKK